MTESATQLRQQNVAGAFRVRRGAKVPAKLILVDDVWTTGVTLTECCRELKLAGAQTVWGVTLLRA